jgi:hypothetical protein
MYSRHNEAFGRIHKLLSYATEQCMNGIALGFATGPSLNLSEIPPICLHHDENYCGWYQRMNGQSSIMSVNVVSTICG